MKVPTAVLVPARLATSAAVAAAVAGQLATSLTFWRAHGAGDALGTYVVNFISFFTVQSNLLAAGVLVVAAVVGARGRTESRSLAVARLAVTTYMLTTGVVYNLVLRAVELPQGATLAWSNEGLHAAAPAYVVLDWLIAPGRGLHRVHLGAVAAYPVLWAVYTLVRGPLVHDPIRGRDRWYPYPGLDPVPAGYGPVLVAVVAVAALVLGAAALLLWYAHRRERAAAPRTDAVLVGRTQG